MLKNLFRAILLFCTASQIANGKSINSRCACGDQSKGKNTAVVCSAAFAMRKIAYFYQLCVQRFILPEQLPRSAHFHFITTTVGRFCALFSTSLVIFRSFQICLVGSLSKLFFVDLLGSSQLQFLFKMQKIKLIKIKITVSVTEKVPEKLLCCKHWPRNKRLLNSRIFSGCVLRNCETTNKNMGNLLLQLRV